MRQVADEYHYIIQVRGSIMADRPSVLDAVYMIKNKSVFDYPIKKTNLFAP